MAASTPPLLCGMPATSSPISTAVRAPRSIGSLRSPMWPMRKTRPFSRDRPPPSETLPFVVISPLPRLADVAVLAPSFSA